MLTETRGFYGRDEKIPEQAYRQKKGLERFRDLFG
jgi:hypothetical protein